MIRLLRDYPNPLTAILDQLRSRAERNEQAHPDFSEVEKFREPLANEDQQAGYMRALEDMRKVFCGDVEETKRMLVDLYTFVPEGRFPLKVSPYSGEPVDPEDYEDCPFFSEHYLYDLMGKNDARTILGLIRQVANAAGVDRYDLQRDINAVFEAKAAEKERWQALSKARNWRREFWDEVVNQVFEKEGKKPFDGRCLAPFCGEHTVRVLANQPALLCMRHQEMADNTNARVSMDVLRERWPEPGTEPSDSFKRSLRGLLGRLAEVDDTIYLRSKAERPELPEED